MTAKEEIDPDEPLTVGEIVMVGILAAFALACVAACVG